MAKKPKKFIYRSNDPPEETIARIKEAVPRYHLEKKEKLTFFQKEPNGFSLGLEYGGHSDGYSYEAEISEVNDGSLIEGIISRDDIYNGKPIFGPIADIFARIGIGILWIGLAIPSLIVHTVKWIRLKIQRRPTNKKQRLVDFMTHFANCEQIKE